MAIVGTSPARKPLSTGHSSSRSDRSHSDREHGRGLAIEAQFCPESVADPFDTVEWDLRVAAIKGEAGEVLFEQTNCEVPAT